MNSRRTVLVVAAMRKMGLWLVIIVGALTLPVAGFAGHKGEPHGKGGADEFFDTPVDVTFRDSDGDGIKSDGAIYLDGENLVEAAKSGRKSYLDIRLDTGNRGLFLDFSSCAIDPCDAPPYFIDPSISVHAVLQVRADGNLQGGPDGGELLRIDFRDDNDKPWRLLFEPSGKGCEESFSAIVMLMSTNPNTWTITADNPEAVACLRESRRGGKFNGYYEMPVEFTVVEKN